MHAAQHACTQVHAAHRRRVAGRAQWATLLLESLVMSTT
jgi:hypothetical protein